MCFDQGVHRVAPTIVPPFLAKVQELTTRAQWINMNRRLAPNVDHSRAPME
jgi:hypothetical protein